ncbi:GDSL esterase/lipase [Trifolium medium]|uniref:GDSL esterase/lipase n=1 Tax=Trifolium medium TaxID=97028 RepID=A0A392MCM1_9FABA|nr:GDSL esterase/lipase [Trifolium medium]
MQWTCHQGCNFAAVGSTILPANAGSISPFGFSVQVSQFLLFKTWVQVPELVAGQNVATFGTDSSKLDELGCLRAQNQAAKAFNLHLQAFCSKLQGQYLDVMQAAAT